jgi:hypothetical protein
MNGKREVFATSTSIKSCALGLLLYGLITSLLQIVFIFCRNRSVQVDFVLNPRRVGHPTQNDKRANDKYCDKSQCCKHFTLRPILKLQVNRGKATLSQSEKLHWHG